MMPIEPTGLLSLETGTSQVLCAAPTLTEQSPESDTRPPEDPTPTGPAKINGLPVTGGTYIDRSRGLPSVG